MKNVFKKLRKPYLSIFLAGLVLFVSCNQYETQTENTENKFDYALFNQNKGNPVFNEIINEIENSTLSKSNSKSEKHENILKVVKKHLNYNLEISPLAFDFNNKTTDEILNIAYTEKAITKSDIKLIKSFMNNMKYQGFNHAIKNYEASVLKMDLSKIEFNKKNQFLNIIKLINHQNKLEKNTNLNAKTFEVDPWDCGLAMVATALSVVGLSTCATLVLCAVAVAAYILSCRSMLKNCLS